MKRKNPTVGNVIGIVGERYPHLCAATYKDVMSGATHVKLDDKHYVMVNPFRSLSDDELKRLKASLSSDATKRLDETPKLTKKTVKKEVTNNGD